METLLTTYRDNTYAVLMVVFGLGFVIFIHELGHFLLAKWAGVKVDMFSIGFGPTLVSFRKGLGLRFGSSVKDYEALHKAEAEGIQSKDLSSIGETEYSIRILPLGGFVKMLGEDAGEGENKTADPRAFHNKPVGSRMAIITAGVIMNLIFGVSCATWVYLRGKPEQPAVIGAVVAGQPAYEAGIRPGDEIVGINGRHDIAFSDLLQSVMLSGAGHAIEFDVKRPGLEEPLHLSIEPRRAAKAPAPTIGILQAQSLELIGKLPKGLRSDDKDLDVVTAVAAPGQPPHPVADIQSLNVLLSRYRNQSLTVVAERGSPDDDRDKKPKSKVEAVVPPRLFVDFGLRMTPGPVVAVRPDSPAAKAGFLKGDRIVSVDGANAIDPMRLPDLAFDHAGKPMTFEVRRVIDGKDQSVTLTATPDASPIWTEPIQPAEPLEIPGLGFAIAIEPKVAAVVSGSTAAKARITPGDVLKSIRFANLKPVGDSSLTKFLKAIGLASRKPASDAGWLKPVVLDGKTAAWPWFFEEIQDADGVVRFEFEKAGTIAMKAEPVAEWYDPRRGLHFPPLFRPLPPQPFGVALSRGWRDSMDVATSIFSIIRGLFQQRVDPNLVGGPVKIGEWAFRVAKSGGLGAFIPFLGILSINLAVINFLPIPPLDGGQMTFLIAEKIRGRPLPENAVLVPTLIGFTFVLLLFAFIFLKDIMSYF